MADEKIEKVPGFHEIEAGTVGVSPKGKRLLDPDVVKRMKEAGLPRPDDVAYGSWNQLQDVRVGPQTLVAHLAACGVKPVEISEATGLCATTVRRYLESEKIKFEIKKLQHRYFGADPMRRFRALTTEATDLLEEVMGDKNAKASVRVIAADKILDRALGKPKQFLQVEGSLIRRIYETLDQPQKPVVDIEPESEKSTVAEVAEPSDNPNTVEKIDRSENPNLQKPPEVSSDDWAKWVDKNI